MQEKGRSPSATAAREAIAPARPLRRAPQLQPGISRPRDFHYLTLLTAGPQARKAGWIQRRAGEINGNPWPLRSLYVRSTNGFPLDPSQG